MIPLKISRKSFGDFFGHNFEDFFCNSYGMSIIFWEFFRAFLQNLLDFCFGNSFWIFFSETALQILLSFSNHFFEKISGMVCGKSLKTHKQLSWKFPPKYLWTVLGQLIWNIFQQFILQLRGKSSVNQSVCSINDI